MFAPRVLALLLGSFATAAQAQGLPARKGNAPAPDGADRCRHRGHPGLPARKGNTPAPVRGVADLHLHQMAALAFGGRYIWGQHDGPPASALRPCSGHSFDGNGFNGGSEGGPGNLKPHGKGGHSSYGGWPRWSSTSHQQVHALWLKKAHAEGLRLIVMPTVHNADLPVRRASVPSGPRAGHVAPDRRDGTKRSCAVGVAQRIDFEDVGECVRSPV
jgi:hypothetical protein